MGDCKGTRGLNGFGTAVLLSIFVVAGPVGCGFGTSAANTVSEAKSSVIPGHIQGGQQPVSGSAIYLYAVPATGGGTSLPLLHGTGYVTSDANGGFVISSDYTCPPGAYVYLLAKGGNPGLVAGTTNVDLTLAAGLGSCSALTSSMSFTINEVTTVAMAYSMAPYATSETQMGAGSPNLSNAFANMANLSDPSSGFARATTPTGGGTVPQAKIDSLANSLAACINSDGTGTACSALMADANVTGTQPEDTFQAVLNIAQNPTTNVSAIYSLAAPGSPFQPSLSQPPPDWTIAIQYTAPPAVTLSPLSATVPQGSQQIFSAAVSGSTAPAFSYSYSTTGNAGSLNEVGGSGQTGQTSFCSAGAQVAYVSKVQPVLTANAADQVTVQAFAGAGCVAGNALAPTASSTVTVTPSSASTIPNFPTTTHTGTVTLPSGVNLPLNSLTVVDSLGSVVPLASGTFNLPRYNNGEQIALVLSPSGKPMLMSWMDTSHPTISASTTAEVLAFFALGGSQMLNESDRNQMIAQIPQLSGFPALVQTVANELAANPNAFAQPDANLTTAMNNLFTGVSGITPFSKSGGDTPRPADVIGTPSAGTPQSGVSVVAQNPFSAYMTNAYRRRTHAYVSRVKETLSGQDTADVAAITDFDIDPTTGLTGGVTGAVSDIFKAYFGTQPTAYAPVSTDPFDLPFVSGFDSTTYQVINLGAGGSGRSSPVPLTPAQQTVLTITAVNGLVNDALVPFVSNVCFGSGFMANSGNTSVGGVANFRSKFILALETNVLALVGNLPGEQSKIVAGDYKGAAADLLFGVANQQFQNAIVNSVQQAVSASSFNNPGSLIAALGNFNVILNAAGGGLQVFDTAVYTGQLLSSDNVDVWTVKSLPTKATLSPPTTTLNGNGSVGLTAAVPSVGNTAGYSFHWTVTAQSGQPMVGNLTELGGGGRTGQTDFCSSTPRVVYINTASVVQFLTQLTTDTVTVTVFNASGCAPAKQLTQPVTATIGTNPNATVNLNPQLSNINPGDTVNFTASYTDPNVTPVSYQWVLKSQNSVALGGNLTGNGGTNSFCSTSPNATYTSTATSPLSATITDIVRVTAFNVAGCPSNSNNQLGYIASAVVSTSAAPRLRVGPTATIHAGDQVGLTASFRLGLANTPTPGSYQWTDTGNYGTLTEVGGLGRNGQTSFCSTSSQVTYVSTVTGTLSQAVVDNITATPFADTNCTPAQRDGLTGTNNVFTDPPAPPFTFPYPINSVLQSGDGNIYATSTYTTPNGASPPYPYSTFDYILKVSLTGVVTILHTFELDTSLQASNNINNDGSNLNPLIEGSDGNLYGSTKSGGPVGNGTIFKIGKDGTYTLLYAFDNIQLLGVTTGVPRGGAIHCELAATIANYAPASGAGPGPIVEGSDGNFYGIAGGGSAYGRTADGVFFRVSPSGAFSVLRTYTYAYFVPSGSQQSICGFSYYLTSPVYVDPVYFLSFGGPPPPVLQALDGNFYGQFITNNSSLPGKLFRLDATGNPSVVHAYASDGSEGTPSTVQLVAGPNQLLYGVGGNGTFNTTTSGGFQFLNSTPFSQLLLGSDQNFYAAYGGVIQQMTTNGALTTTTAVTTPTPPQPASATGPLVEIAGGNLVGAGQATDNTQSPPVTTNFVFNVPANGGTLTGPIQLAFPTSSAPVNQPVVLTWRVMNAFSATAQQCHASVQGPAGGAGNWKGAQVGSLVNGVYTGTASVVPSIPGTYTYALTCGGTESGFATLTVH